MEKNYPEEYKNEILKKYETEKNGVHSNFLLNPSPAKLRDLCVIILSDTKNQNDFISFRNFLGFNFSEETIHELNDQKIVNKFKPIGKFFKRESELSSHFALDMAALLVNYESRPYPKFTRLVGENKSLTTSAEDSKKEKVDETTENVSQEDIIDTTPINIIISSPSTSEKNMERKRTLIWITVGLLIMVLSSIIYYYSNTQDCMIWKNDHYEAFNCDDVDNSNYWLVKPKDEKLIHDFQKITTCDTTQFFDGNGKEKIWYGKSLDGNNMDCFNAPGLHPETGGTLKKITPYIIERYGLNKKLR